MSARTGAAASGGLNPRPDPMLSSVHVEPLGPTGYLVTDRERPTRTLIVSGESPAGVALSELATTLASITSEREDALLGIVARAWVDAVVCDEA